MKLHKNTYAHAYYNTGATILLQKNLGFSLLMVRNVKNSNEKFFVETLPNGVC